MKSKLFIALCIGIAIAACNKEKSTVTTTQQSYPLTHHLGAKFTDSTDTTSSRFISASEANEMINSYLYSINANSGSDTNVHSYSVNADSLRAYLSNTSIKNVKLMFAHTMGYINAGNYGVNAGTQSGALTIIIAAYDSLGNYVYYNSNFVLDHIAPCPFTCPSGNAGSNTLN